MNGRSRSQQEDSNFLEVQPGIHIHYRIYRAITTFRKPQRKSGSAISQVRRCASTNKDTSHSSKDEFDLRFSDSRKDIVPTLDFGEPDAECELDVPDGLEDLGDRSPSSATHSTSSKEPNSIIFVLLHGYLGCTTSWEQIAVSLRQYGTVISFDRPGFGRSSKPTKKEKEIWEKCSIEGLSSCTFKGCRDDYDGSDSEGGLRTSKHSWVNPYSDLYAAHVTMRLLHHLLDHDDEKTETKRNRSRKHVNKTKRGEKRSIILVGHSLGGRCALNTFYYFPKSFSGLIFVNPALFTDAASVPGFAPNLVKQVGPSFLKMLPTLVPPRIAYYDYDSCIDEETRMSYQQIFYAENWQEALRLWSKNHFSEPRLSPERVLLNVTIPVLVTAGDHDHVVSSSDCRKILKVLKSGHQPPALYAEFQQTGHCPMEEKPALFVTVVEAFLEKFIKSIAYEKGVFTGSTSSIIAAYRNQYQDPFREGCIVIDNISGDFSLLCAPTVGSNLSKSHSIPKDLDEIIPM